MITLAKLSDIDASTKPSGADEEWRSAHRQYLDQSRSETSARLRQLKLGLRDNAFPIEISLVRRVIDRLAVIYDRPPTRWLVRDGERLEESSAESQIAARAFERAQYDLAWRQVDRLRALMRQVVVRFYPSDDRGSVVLRVFPPYSVKRCPSLTSPDSLDADDAFALAIGRDNWEKWERTGDGWRCTWIDERDRPLDVQPFASTNGLSPYGILPAQIVFDDYSGGASWLPPRQSRRAFQDAINAQANDLWNLIVHQAHTQLAAKTNDASQVPTELGPDVIAAFPRDTELQVLDNNPKIDGVMASLNNLIRLWTLCEDLPTAEFDDAKEVVTGAALKVASRALLARREAQVPLAHRDEAQAFARFRAVHNAHAGSTPAWDIASIDSDLGLEVEIAELEIASDDREQLEAGSRGLALGTISVIDLIQAQHGLGREDAIKRYERIRADLSLYPPIVVAGATAVQTGPRTTDVAVDGRSTAQHVDVAPEIEDVSMDAPDAPVTSEPEAAQAAVTQSVALNGAQVTSAQGIVVAVSRGELPRESGIAMLTAFFGLPADVAERVMGTVGRGFQPAVAQQTVPPAAQSA